MNFIIHWRNVCDPISLRQTLTEAGASKLVRELYVTISDAPVGVPVAISMTYQSHRSSSFGAYGHLTNFSRQLTL